MNLSSSEAFRLSDNKIVRLDPENFAGLTLLDQIDLSHKRIFKIQKKMFAFLKVSIWNSIMFNKSTYRLLKSAHIDIALSVNLFIVSSHLNFSLVFLRSAVCSLALSCENGRLRSTVYNHHLSCVESLSN
jgi:Leucine-rich repeat (LRR) protein